MKKLICILICAATMLSLAACGSKNDTPKVYIGVMESQAGDDNVVRDELVGLEFGRYMTPKVKLNKTNYEVEFIYADCGTTEEETIKAANTLVDKGVSLVLGAADTQACLTASQIFSDNGITAISVMNGHREVTAGNYHYYSIANPVEDQAVVMAHFAKEALNCQHVYLVGQLGSDYDQSLIQAFERAGQELELITKSEYFYEGNSDFSAYMRAAIEMEAGCIFVACDPKYARSFINQVDSQGVGLPILSTYLWDSKEAIEPTLFRNEKLYITTYYTDGASEDFETAYTEWQNLQENAKMANIKLSPIVAMGYDGYNTAIAALKNANSTNKADILAAMPNVTNSGVCGSISFDDYGAVIRKSMVIKKVDNVESTWAFHKRQTFN